MIHQPVRSYRSAGAGALALAGLMALSGCPADKDEDGDLRRLRQDGQAMFGRDAPAPRPGGRSMPLVRLSATAVAFPAGTLTESETVWGALDHTPWAPDVRARLTLNGVRLGMLKASAWEGLAKTFERLNGRRLKSARLPAFPGSPVQVFIQRNDTYRTIFTYRMDQTMFGQDYPPGDAMLAVHCLVEPGTPSRLVLAAMPQVRAARQQAHYTKTDGQYTFIKRPILHSFDELSWRVAMTVDDIVVIGPGRDARRSSSAGRLFFFRDVGGAMFETLLLLAPSVVMVGGPGGPTPPPKAASRPAGARDRPRTPGAVPPGASRAKRD